ncbi:MAG: hypothetical protein GY841_24170 [FCB group bacterium]|nr:hypothetical protein [FCB group bacterium]
MEMINLTRPIAWNSTNITLIRENVSAYDSNGRWIDGPEDETPIAASVQPLKPNELKDLPENRHSEEWVKIYTSTEIKGVSVNNQSQPDRIKSKDKIYEVHTVTNWDDAGGYYKATAVRVGQ